MRKAWIVGLVLVLVLAGLMAQGCGSATQSEDVQTEAQEPAGESTSDLFFETSQIMDELSVSSTNISIEMDAAYTEEEVMQLARTAWPQFKAYEARMQSVRQRLEVADVTPGTEAAVATAKQGCEQYEIGIGTMCDGLNAMGQGDVTGATALIQRATGIIQTGTELVKQAQTML